MIKSRQYWLKPGTFWPEAARFRLSDPVADQLPARSGPPMFDRAQSIAVQQPT
jgi:hypothetical protein